MIKLCKIVRNVRFWFLICPKLVGTPGAWWLCTWKLMKDVQFNNWINCSFRHFISNGCTISHGLLLQWLGLSFYQLQKKIQKNRKSKEEGRTSRKFITCEWTNTVQKQEKRKITSEVAICKMNASSSWVKFRSIPVKNCRYKRLMSDSLVAPRAWKSERRTWLILQTMTVGKNTSWKYILEIGKMSPKMALVLWHHLLS